MQSLSDYTPSTPASELYHFLAEAIMRNNISDFSGLLAYTKSIPLDQKTSQVLISLFRLIQKLYWGFFRDVDNETYPKVWKEIVLPHPRIQNCGDLKRNLTISDIYVGILDLHGYTRFCDKNKNNLSMLKALDDLIQVEMTKLAKARNVVLQRRQGDEMVLVGASAVDLVEATLDIISFFASHGSTETQKKIHLPDMHISAGIAGGNKYTPFIITLDGDLSGGVVNTAARLQVRANELSGDRSRIVVSRPVYTSYLTETKNSSDQVQRKPPIHFFDSGYIRFKGIDVAVCEVLCDEKDQYKAIIEKDMLNLYKAIETGSWKEGLFTGLILLLIRLYKFMPPFKIECLSNGIQTTLNNENLSVIAQEVMNSFKIKQDYCEAAEGLSRLAEYSRLIPGFDRLSLEYTEQIAGRYRCIASEYSSRLNSRLKELAGTTLTAKGKQLYEESRKGLLIQERLNQEIRKKMSVMELSQIWGSSVDSLKNQPDPFICSGKQ